MKKVCDICKNHYEAYNKERQGDGINSISFISEGIFGIRKTKGIMHCCPSCMGHLIDYINKMHNSTGRYPWAS